MCDAPTVQETELQEAVVNAINQAGKNGEQGWDVIQSDIEDGISWVINGNSVTGESYSIQIELSRNGEFGFTATLNINLESKNAGYYANLFYFHEDTEELEFIGASQIDEDGVAALEFIHASAYTIVITEEPMNAEPTEDDTDNKQEGDTQTVGAEVEATEETSGNIALWIVLGLIAIVMIGGVAVVVARKKEEKEEKE